MRELAFEALVTCKLNFWDFSAGGSKQAWRTERAEAFA